MDHEDTLNTCKTILASVVLLAVPLVLIKIQPDLKKHDHCYDYILSDDVCGRPEL